MTNLWKKRLKQRLKLMKRLEQPGESEKFIGELRNARIDWIRKTIYRGSYTATNNSPTDT